MKIRFLKNWCGEIEKNRLQEVWDVSYNRWDELSVERIEIDRDKIANLVTDSGDVIYGVPLDCFTF
jgi:hypothetical protein